RPAAGSGAPRGGRSGTWSRTGSSSTSRSGGCTGQTPPDLGGILPHGRQAHSGHIRERRLDRLAGPVVHIRPQVRVHVQGDRRGAVPEKRLHGLHRLAVPDIRIGVAPPLTPPPGGTRLGKRVGGGATGASQAPAYTANRDHTVTDEETGCPHIGTAEGIEFEL